MKKVKTIKQRLCVICRCEINKIEGKKTGKAVICTNCGGEAIPRVPKIYKRHMSYDSQKEYNIKLSKENWAH